MTEVEARGDPTYCGDVGETAASNETSRVIVGLTTGVVLGVGFLACLVSDRNLALGLDPETAAYLAMDFA